jgi:hypothetical protein
MTSQGTAHDRFERAIHRGHIQAAEMAAREMGDCPSSTRSRFVNCSPTVIRPVTNAQGARFGALVTAGSAATSTFATGMVTPETITPTASGGFYVTDAGPPGTTSGTIWSVPAGGGAASPLAQFPSLSSSLESPRVSLPHNRLLLSRALREGRNVGDSTPLDCRRA